MEVTAAAAPARRPRRRRGAEESLLSVVLVTEAVLLIFVALAANGLRALPTAVALGGGAGAIVVVLVASALVRWRAGVLFGWAVQVGLVLCGLVLPVMWGIGALFLAIWIYCALTGRRLDRRNAALAGAASTASETTTTPDQGEP